MAKKTGLMVLAAEASIWKKARLKTMKRSVPVLRSKSCRARSTVRNLDPDTMSSPDIRRKSARKKRKTATAAVFHAPAGIAVLGFCFCGAPPVDMAGVVHEGVIAQPVKPGAVPLANGAGRAR